MRGLRIPISDVGIFALGVSWHSLNGFEKNTHIMCVLNYVLFWYTIIELRFNVAGLLCLDVVRTFLYHTC